MHHPIRIRALRLGLAACLLAGALAGLASANAPTYETTILFTHDTHDHFLPMPDEEGGEYGGYTRLEFSIPSRGLIGYRGEFMTDTKGNGIMNTIFDGYGPYKGDLNYRKTGSLIAYESGETITYGLFNAQERGILFVGPGEKVYGGMVIGQNPKAEDIEVNVCKTKKLTNTRSSSADEALKLVPKKIMSLEQCLEFIDTDELLEVTPTNLRIRKKILDPTMRKRAAMKKA